MNDPYTPRLTVNRTALSEYNAGVEQARNGYDRHLRRIDADHTTGEKRAGREWAIENAEIATNLVERYSRKYANTRDRRWRALELVATAVTNTWLKRAENGR